MAKKKGMKRAYLKRWSASTMKDVQRPAWGGRHSFYGERPKPTVPDAWLENLFPGVNINSPERRAALDRAKTIAAAFNHDFMQVLETSQLRTIRIFYNSSLKKCWILEENYAAKFIRKSITYGHKDRAMRAYDMDGVRWIERVSIFRADDTATDSP